jgi:hypothetical protein
VNQESVGSYQCLAFIENIGAIASRTAVVKFASEYSRGRERERERERRGIPGINYHTAHVISEASLFL